MDDEGIFLWYAKNSKGYRCYNKRLHKMVDCIDVKVDEGIPAREVYSNDSSTEDTTKAEDEYVQESENEDSESDEDTNTQIDSNQQTTSNSSSRITQKNHPTSRIIGEKYKGVQTRRKLMKNTEQSHIAFISMLEPKNFN
jgi:DNA-binding transcriptional MerR regulator